MQTQAITLPTVDKVLAILGATQDGDHLSPSDLSLTEVAVNGWLSAEGAVKFEALYQSVCVARNYDRNTRWLFGIEGVTQDHQGYVYWRGANIEHFSHADPQAKKTAVIALADTCRRMESFGVRPSNTDVFLRWCTVMSDLRPLEHGEMEVASAAELTRLIAQEYRVDEHYVAERMSFLQKCVDLARLQLSDDVETVLLYVPSCAPGLVCGRTFSSEPDSQRFIHTLRSLLVRSGDRQAADLVQGLIRIPRPAGEFVGVYISSFDASSRLTPARALLQAIDQSMKEGSHVPLEG